MKAKLLGADIDRLTMDQAIKAITALVRVGKPCRVITLNPEYLYQAVTADSSLLELVRKADLVTADGEGIVWAGRVAGTPFPERVTGIDLMLRLMPKATAEGWRVYLLGSAPGVAEEAAENLRRMHPGLQMAGTHHGYFQPAEEAAVVAEIKQAVPQLLFVALGAPKQEIWIDKYIDEIGPVMAMGVGGSLDVIAGRVTRAPRWMQRLKIEWLGRLVMAPSRWRRMMVLPKFAWLVFKKYRLNWH
ncbi:N-acetylmannosaminyltransferase [Desulfotomaculum arcticum]|uniref:N-acetylglucosaminyldiphosphoundecaprenol N-acetyl-beta-D-mannosaminyltransferase n=1 Tax=Desulfotruncus arcticus DSM 17038 TaxID=1121424 RepID=A0A1I2X0T4_9FIRM|nr:WecB/TagA/CpsF family glycosyltransferase [Desulfotruncus arcticus]SFH07123.1 N-acetylmannosaminyltransferase [Desulfotomaculum arcticum] [Desulfotruncus arcticus DSM 17038]